jgi:hypothetical protein
MPNAWAGAAEGFNSGVNNAIKILGAQQSQEEAGMKKKLFEQSAQEYEYMNKPRTTFGAIIKGQGLDDAGTQDLLQVGGNFGFKPEDPISLKHMEQIKKLIDSDPAIEQKVIGHKVRMIDEKLIGVTDPTQKKALEEERDSLSKYGTDKKREISKAWSERTKAEAALKAASVKEAVHPKTVEEAIAMGWDPAKVKQMQAAAVAQKLAGKTPADHVTWAPGEDPDGNPVQISNRGEIKAMPGAAEKKAKTDQLKALEATVTAEEAKIAAGKRVPFTEQEVETLRERSMAIDGNPRYEYKVTEKNWISKDKTRVGRISEPAKTGGKVLTKDIAAQYQKKYKTRTEAEAAARKDGYKF